MKAEQLIFVYKADSDVFSRVTDFAHKILSPATYSCQLCALTYGNFTERKEWKAFIENFPAQVSFLYQDQFEKKYHVQAELPAVFLQSASRIDSLITASEINHCKTLDDLKRLVETKYEWHVQHHHTNIQ